MADLRLKTAVISSLETEVREREEEMSVCNRAKLRLESSLEAQQHEISLLEESKKKLSHELMISQVGVLICVVWPLMRGIFICRLSRPARN